MKHHVASRNINFRLFAVEELTREARSQFNVNEFAKYAEHVQVEESKFKGLRTL